MTAVRDASTVVLLRDGAGGLEVWLLTRATSMAFAGGMAVFPGGRVDEADADLPFAGDASAHAARLGCDPANARVLLGAAVREVFEETGVLLTVPPADLAESRADVESGRLGFGALLRRHELRVDAEALHPWARWVTPPGETRRYDARFFLAALPAGADPRHVTTEASAADWFGVGDAFERAQRGELGMMPPTVMTLASLVEFASVASAIEAAENRVLDAVRPTLTRDETGGYLVTLPDGTTFALGRSAFAAGADG